MASEPTKEEGKVVPPADEDQETTISFVAASEASEPEPAANKDGANEYEQHIADAVDQESTPVEGGQDETKAEDGEAVSEAAPSDNAGNEEVDDSIANSKGAQILMNRFSSLTQRANQNAQTLWTKQSPAIQERSKAIQDNAKNFWIQTPNLPEMPRLRGAMRSLTTKDTSKHDTNEGTPVGGEKIEGDVSTQAATPGKTPPSKQSSFTDSSIGDEEDEVSSDGKGTESDDMSEEGVEKTAPRQRVGVAFVKASTAASVVAESVATGFRGRYSSRASSVSVQSGQDSEAEEKPAPESQTALILKSRVGRYMQDILDKLEDHEFPVLLGNGMLGVNLKQCYLKNHGVFVDFLVAGGQADLSGVIRTGDLIQRVGDEDLRKGTIIDIPQRIAKSKRPSVLIVASGTKVPLERMNFVDIAVAMMHRSRAYYNKRGSLSNLPSANPTMEHASEETDSDTTAPVVDVKSMSENEILAAESIDCFVSPPAPTLDVRKEFISEVHLRCFDKFIVEGLAQVADMDTNFRAALTNALLTCAIDSRRLTFLARHFSSDQEVVAHDQEENRMTTSSQLMLFLELMSFIDLYEVTPAERLRDVASRVSYKFFLPTKVGNRLQPPLFDFHKIVPDASLRHLEFVLSGKSKTIPRDIFLDFQKAVVDSLTGAPFLSFLTSSECARMRAYLRDTAPYVNLPTKALFDALVVTDKHSGAKNSFAYMLLFLICQLEKEPSGEHKFAGDGESNRLLGASNDICCAVFIKRTLVPTLSSAKSKLEQLSEGEDLDISMSDKVIKACEKLWGVYLFGASEAPSKIEDIESAYSSVQSELESISSAVLKQGLMPLDRNAMKTLLDSKLVEKAEILAGELLYNYAANVHTKFRSHKYHEWMCNEICKVKTVDPNWTNNYELPSLPPGCIKRLLRKAELPGGVSSHKPHRAQTESEIKERGYPNAEYAVVFGTSVGNELAAQMPVPGIGPTDIRRYICLPVALDRNFDIESFSEEAVLPPTFESYAVTPTYKPYPFSNAFGGDQRASSDGWQVSLISFAIPNADASEADSALYGVSLYFQRSGVSNDENWGETMPTKLSCVESNGNKDSPSTTMPPESSTIEEDLDSFISPISFDALNKVSEEATVENTRIVKVSHELPKLMEQMEQQQWMKRVQNEEHRNPSTPFSIGLALVSKRNVILAMKDTLSRLVADFSRRPSRDHGKSELVCNALVNLLGNFTSKDVETVSLRCILEPYLKVASSPWIDRPIKDQEAAFEKASLQQLTDCLPPIPLALLFATTLLEQKIVLSSSRRSILHAASVSLAAMLRPLKWSHLLVPMVPSTLASDLIQYPAPFILGVPSEDSENSEILGDLPRDVTLVDLDVGRVILAPSFGADNEMVTRSSNPDETALALRSQILYLAQCLGGVFGRSLRPTTWCCDTIAASRTTDSLVRVDQLKDCANDFVQELLEGVASCSYWIEETAQNYGTTVEPTVLFDEDKFFEIKNRRSKNACHHLFQKNEQSRLPLNLEHFDLVLESFLRCQSMSTYISSRPKTEMLYY